MVSRKVTVINPGGLHLRPAGNLCKEALKYRSKIQLVCRDTEANAKSVLSVLGACVKYGEGGIPLLRSGRGSSAGGCRGIDGTGIRRG